MSIPNNYLHYYIQSVKRITIVYLFSGLFKLKGYTITYKFEIELFKSPPKPP